MGFLSYAYGPGWTDRPYRPQQQIMAPRPQPIQYRAAQQPPPPMPLAPPNLSAPSNGLPPVAPPVTPQPQPQAQATPQAQPSFWDRFNTGMSELPNNALFNLGISLLGNAQGSNWTGVGQDMRSFGQQQMLRRRYDNEERRANAQEQRDTTRFGWMTEQQRDAEAQQQRYEQWAAQQNNAAAVNPEAAYAAYMEAQALANQPITPYQREALALQRRGIEIDASRAGRGSLTPAQERLYRNDYTGFQQDLADQVGGVVMGAMPYALQIGPGGAPPPSMSRDQVLVSDQGLVRAVARLQTGPGVLTEGEVRDTVGQDIYNNLQTQGAAFRLNERLRPETRDALARMIQAGVRRVSTRAWDTRENAVAAYQDVTGRDPVGWGLPQFAHPGDLGSLYQAERIAGQNGAPSLRPNDTRIAPSGRRYTYVGPGNWLPAGEGDTAGYLAGRQQRLERGGTASTQTQTQTPQSGSFDTLPPASQFAEGQTIVDQQTGRTLVVRNGRWVPQQQQGSLVTAGIRRALGGNR